MSRMNRSDRHGPQLQTRASADDAGRIDVIDMLRGFALAAILLIHLAAFARPGVPPGFAYNGGPLNESILAGLILFVEGKFFSLFAFLFGIGFALQYERAGARNRPFVPTFRRRLLILGLIGMLHIVLIWEGDILLLYAAIGLLLIPLRDWPARRVIRWIVLLLAVPLLLIGFAFAGLLLARNYPEAATRLSAAELQFSREFAESRAAITARYTSDDLLVGLVGRVTTYIGRLPLLLIRAPGVLAMFLLGFLAGRRGILRDVEQNLPLLRRACVLGLGLGLAASTLVTVAYTALSPFAALTVLGFNQVFAGPVLAIGYGAAFVLLARRPLARRFLAPLATYGRMALSMYLLQTAICGFLFYGIGLGLVQEIPPYQYVGLMVLINLMLIALSALWLRRFRYGPIEWIWRSLTLGKAQSFLVGREATMLPPRPQSPAAPGSTDDRHRDRSFDARHGSEQQ